MPPEDEVELHRLSDMLSDADLNDKELERLRSMGIDPDADYGDASR